MRSCWSPRGGSNRGSGERRLRRGGPTVRPKLTRHRTPPRRREANEGSPLGGRSNLVVRAPVVAPGSRPHPLSPSPRGAERGDAFHASTVCVERAAQRRMDRGATAGSPLGGLSAPRPLELRARRSMPQHGSRLPLTAYVFPSVVPRSDRRESFRGRPGSRVRDRTPRGLIKGPRAVPAPVGVDQEARERTEAGTIEGHQVNPVGLIALFLAGEGKRGPIR